MTPTMQIKIEIPDHSHEDMVETILWQALADYTWEIVEPENGEIQD